MHAPRGLRPPHETRRLRHMHITLYTKLTHIISLTTDMDTPRAMKVRLQGETDLKCKGACMRRAPYQRWYACVRNVS